MIAASLAIGLIVMGALTRNDGLALIGYIYVIVLALA